METNKGEVGDRVGHDTSDEDIAPDIDFPAENPEEEPDIGDEDK